MEAFCATRRGFVDISKIEKQKVVFQVPYAEIAGKTLVLSVFDFDRFSKHDQIGQLNIPLTSIDLGKTVDEWRDLVPPDDGKEVSLYQLSDS